MEKTPIITLNSEEKDFLFTIDSRIKSILLELPVQYHEILQVVNGSRFRPLLTYYSYKLFSENLNEKVYKSAIAIELIHKSSIIIDDIIATGGTIVNAVKILKEYGAKSVDVCCVHPILVNGATMRIYAAGANSLISTNSLSADSSRVSLAKSIANVLRD